MKLCGKCQSIRYCSVDCQRSHWSTHKVACSQLSLEKQKQSEKKAACSKPNVKKQDQSPQITSTPRNSPALTDIIKFVTDSQENGRVKPTLIKQLKAQGHNGLKNGVNCTELITFLKDTWTEDDFSLRIKALTPFALKGYPLHMLELSRACGMNAMNQLKNNRQLNKIEAFKDSIKWFVLGKQCLNIDIVSIENVSRSDSQLAQIAFIKALLMDKFIFQYSPVQIGGSPLSPEIAKATIQLVPEWKPSEDNPSPRYILGDVVPPAEGWLEVRKHWQQQLVEALRMPEITSRLVDRASKLRIN